MSSIGRLLVGSSGTSTSLALLILRVGFGGFMAVGHGWVKAQLLLKDASKFPDPLGIGSQASLLCAVGAELLCCTLIALGLFTRLACLPMLFTMFVAATIVHRADPLFLGSGAAKEPAIIYAIAFAAILIAGPGRYSLDHRLFAGSTVKK